MDRGATSDFLAEVAKEANKPIHLVSVHFDDDVTAGDQIVYMTDTVKDVTWGGNDYSAVGGLLTIAKISEEVDVVVSKIRMTLDGVGSAWISNVLNKKYIDRQVKVYIGFLDDSNAVIADPVLIFDGRIDRPAITEDPDRGTATVQLTATNAWVDFTRVTGRHTNHEEQQLYFSGDKGFEFASEVAKDLPWGRT
jgi:hypothetical protein